MGGQLSPPLRDDMAALQKHSADLFHQRRALAHELVTDPVQGLDVELRLGLERHEPRRWAGGRLGDGFGVAVVVLLRLDVRAHIFRQHQANRVSLLHQGSAHVVRTAACLHRHDAPRQLRPEGDHRLASHPAAQHDSPGRVQADEAAAVLAQIDPQHRDRHRSAPSLISATLQA
ncbi:hypothetical protein QR78_11630 [Methylobacterium indicum]|uniref:Uncharacterized protein n=1 Tax=Methylobacterium indicum TaxID=1775910 RepID=A0ABR5H8G5_9HYPH|nr:hypothetical protein QR78_11630 [Methylobacterium indicum]KMO20914.1 hypothetical protein QR79_17460 [Methylobacterium indicum]